VLALPLAVQAAPRDDLEALRGRIERLQRELARSEENRADAADALRESERAISAANRRLAELGAEQQQLGQALAQLQTDARALTGRIDLQREELGAVLRAAHRRGTAASIPLLLSGREPGEVARSLHYLGYVYRAQAAQFEALRRDLGALDALDAQTRAKAEALAQLEARQAAERSDLLRQKRARDAALSRVAADIQRQRREIGTLRRNEARLERLVRRLAEELAKRPTRPAAPRRGAQPPGADPGPAAGVFGKLMGRLRMPVHGELANRFGSPRLDTGVPWHGVFIATAQGAAVQAVAPGRVVFSDWLRGYGNLLILDHGEGYMTLYANNETLLRQVGDAVQAGEQVAAAGASGGSPQTGLYFELRYRGRPMDPLRWVKAK
jgi:septal ring factor EnvC (AmiA/AmiB activator)